MLIYIEAIISTSTPLLLPNYCLITAYLRLKTAIWPRPDRDLYVLFKTPAEAANQKRFAAIAQIVARLEARDWLYRVEVIDLSDYAGCDLNGDPING